MRVSPLSLQPITVQDCLVLLEKLDMNGWLIHAGTLGYFLVPPQHDLTQHKRAVKPAPCTVSLHWAEQPDMSEVYLKVVILKALSGCH